MDTQAITNEGRKLWADSLAQGICPACGTPLKGKLVCDYCQHNHRPHTVYGGYDPAGADTPVLSANPPFCNYCHTRHYGYQDHDMA